MEMIGHYYHYIQNWFDFQDFYRKQVLSANNGSHFVEVGSWKGSSTVYMAVEIANSGKLIQFDAVDTWGGDAETGGSDASNPDWLYDEFRKNIAPVLSYVNPIRMASVDASKTYKNKSLDLVYIDANHTYDYVKQDILSWLPKIKEGGIIAGHDYATDWDGVVKAVNEIFPTVGVEGRTWYTEVTK
jgi:hypothetical protein